MNILQLAGSLPRDPQFLEWCELFVPPGDSTVSPDEAAEFIRVVCGIDSRRQLAYNRDAEQRFHNLLRKPFVEWRQQQQPHRRAA